MVRPRRETRLAWLVPPFHISQQERTWSLISLEKYSTVTILFNNNNDNSTLIYITFINIQLFTKSQTCMLRSTPHITGSNTSEHFPNVVSKFNWKRWWAQLILEYFEFYVLQDVLLQVQYVPFLPKMTKNCSIQNIYTQTRRPLLLLSSTSDQGKGTSFQCEHIMDRFSEDKEHIVTTSNINPFNLSLCNSRTQGRSQFVLKIVTTEPTRQTLE